MEKIYSKIDTEELLFIIQRKNKICEKRKDLTNSKEALQTSCSIIKKDTMISPHIHNPQERTIQKTQEAIILIKGKLETSLYDKDRSFIKKSSFGHFFVVWLTS